jgi:hypothetical protein
LFNPNPAIFSTVIIHNDLLTFPYRFYIFVLLSEKEIVLPKSEHVLHLSVTSITASDFIVFVPTIYRARGEHANHYTTDAVIEVTDKCKTCSLLGSTIYYLK